MELGPKRSEFFDGQVETLSKVGHKEFSKSHEVDLEVVKAFIVEALKKDHKANEGNNGVIFKLKYEVKRKGNKEASDADEEPKQYAVKILKVGTFADLKAEYENQLRAYEILEAEFKSGANPQDYAKVPTPAFCFDVKADEETKHHLEDEGVNIPSEQVGMLIMDWIEGEDVATHIFKEALKRKNSLYLETIKPNDFNQLHAAVATEFRFAKPGGKATRAGDKAFEEQKVMQQNEQSVYKFLKKDGYTFPKETLARIKNTLDLFKRNGLQMWDSHARNIMLSQADGDPYLIDFAQQKNIIGEEARVLDPYALVRQLDTLTRSVEEDIDLEQDEKYQEWAKDYSKYTSNARWKEKYVDRFQDSAAFSNQVVREVSIGPEVDENLYALLYKMNQGEIESAYAKNILNELSSSRIDTWRKDKIKFALKKASL
mgnify:CR=1 FL=1